MSGSRVIDQPDDAPPARGAAADPSTMFWACNESDLLQALDSSRAGLSAREAEHRRFAGTGPPHLRRTQLILLLRQFATPITVILVLATIVSAAVGETVDAGIILAIVFASGLLSFSQEYSASRAMQTLLASVEVCVNVRRDGAEVTAPAREIVPGDVILLDIGDLIPGDCRLLRPEALMIDEAALTGESFPVEKSVGALPPETPLQRRTNCLFRGTHVVRGHAEALVVSVGEETEFGRIAARLERRAPPTGFERGVIAFGLLLLRVMSVLVGSIFVIDLVLARPFFESLLFSIALAVGLTPQLLPAIVSVSLSIGARRMARQQVIVKRLSALEDFGGMDVLCTDKTGTLTTGTVRLEGALAFDGTPSDEVLRAACLNAFHHAGFPNPIDDAILQNAPSAFQTGHRIADVPYDFSRRRMSVLVDDDGIRLITKGAFEDVLAVCSTTLAPDGRTVPLEEQQSPARDLFSSLSAGGLRVLGVATKSMPAREPSPADESNMTLLGLLAFADPLKPNVDAALRELARLDISLRVITGDNRLAAAHVARAVGLRDDTIVTGIDVDRLRDEELWPAVRGVDVFAEIDPIQKERIVRAYRLAGHTVGFLGDGINDAPSLHTADVGISVDTAADVAKQSAAIVLLEKDLNVLIGGVKLGRETFANTSKYIFVTTSASFGNMASMAFAALFLPFLPLLPAQVLLLNFLSDFPATTIATDAVDAEQVLRPGVWDMRFIRDFMIVFGLTSSAFDLLTFAVLRLHFHASAELFRSAWFIESVATELAVMLILRTRRPAWRSRPGLLLAVSSAAMAAATLVLVLSPAGGRLGFVTPTVGVFAALAALTAAYVVATEVLKPPFYARFAPRT
jgi:Mg2+-importing ATPase